MSEHTPGPWEVNDTNRSGDLFIGLAGEVNSFCIAVMQTPFPGIPGCDSAEVVAANARLIAASPDLLAACEAAMRIEALWCPAATSAMPNPDEAMALDTMRRYFVDAIAKARGAK